MMLRYKAADRQSFGKGQKRLRGHCVGLEALRCILYKARKPWTILAGHQLHAATTKHLQQCSYEMQLQRLSRNSEAIRSTDSYAVERSKQAAMYRGHCCSYVVGSLKASCMDAAAAAKRWLSEFMQDRMRFWCWERIWDGAYANRSEWRVMNGI